MKIFFKLLNEPFPDARGFKSRCLKMAFVGVFVCLFLYLLRPFDLSELSNNLFLICLCYGFITFLFGSSYYWFSDYVLRIKSDVPSWTLKRWIIHNIILVAWIAVGNYVFQFLLQSQTQFNLVNFLLVQRNTMLIGVFPVVFSGLLIQVLAINANLDEAVNLVPREQNTEDQINEVSFDISSTEVLNLTAEAILYIEAMQNYISICYREGDMINTNLVRNTMTKTELKFHGSSVIKCHRSFLVNVDAVTQVSGNAQGLKLRLDAGVGKEIPVSRAYISTLKEFMQ